MNSLVSICIPNYNGEKYLRESLDSALAQTYQNTEILVVDNGSTDESANITAEYARKDPRVRLVQNEKNFGAVQNFNRCVSLGRGEWIKFLFHDDILEPECIEKMIKANSRGMLMVVCDRDVIFDEASIDHKNLSDFIKSNNMFTTFSGLTSILPEMFCDALLKKWMVNFIGEPVAVLLHRSVFPKYGIFNQDLIQLTDLEYWARIGSNEGVLYIPEKLARFRLHPQAGTALNHVSRKFRMAMDEVICCHNYAFLPEYRKLRVYASQTGPPTNLQQILASLLKGVRKANKYIHTPDGRKNNELLEMTRNYPLLSCVKKIPLSFTYMYYKWKIRNLYRKVDQYAE
jgi:glycosyltransferase involved in cell wall biosynthesis